MITNDAVLLGLLAATLGVVFWTSGSEHPVWRTVYRFVPTLLLCYFIPSLYNTLGLIDPAGSVLYDVARLYLLPATLGLLTLSVDIPAIVRLGPKLLALFFTGTLTVIAGGPLSLALVGLVSPETVSGDVWRGLTAVAGSWIGGGANMAAMKDVFEIDDGLFGTMVAVDVLVASVWLALMLYLAGRSRELDARWGADTAALEALRERVARLQLETARVTSMRDLMLIVAIGFTMTGLSHALGVPLAAWITAAAPQLVVYSLTSSFFWIVVLATTFGLVASFTPARHLEGAGASKVGSVLLYFLIATIGMQMDLGAIFSHTGLFAVGGIWLLFHGVVMFTVMRLLRAPLFYLAIGSEANIGGAASSPVVASAFHPALAPVGVLLAVLGYALGTYGGWLCGQLMRITVGGT